MSDLLILLRKRVGGDMVIRYHCRHCEVEIGSLPLASAGEVLELVKALEGTEKEKQFLNFEDDGRMTVHCICEQCEQALSQFPNYHTLKKWLQ